MVMMKNYKNMT